MSASVEYFKEKEDIDRFIRNGFTITSILENLDGAKVTFKSQKANDADETLQLLTADARKYVSMLIFIRM